MSRLSQTDDVDANQLIALLKLKDEEVQLMLRQGLTDALSHTTLCHHVYVRTYVACRCVVVYVRTYVLCRHELMSL